MEVTRGLAESNGSLLPGLWRDSLHVTCGLTACTPGSVLGNEYGKTLPLRLPAVPRLYAKRGCSTGVVAVVVIMSAVADWVTDVYYLRPTQNSAV